MTIELVREKVGEAEFFLRLMEDAKGDDLRFGRLMSAFLSSFGSIFHRLAHLLEGSEEERDRILETHPDWKCLFDLRNDEVHREGVLYYRMPTIRTVPVESESGKFRLGPHRRQGRFRLVWNNADFTYQFHNRPGDLLRVCAESVSGVGRLLDGPGLRLRSTLTP